MPGAPSLLDASPLVAPDAASMLNRPEAQAATACVAEAAAVAPAARAAAQPEQPEGRWLPSVAASAEGPCSTGTGGGSGAADLPEAAAAARSFASQVSPSRSLSLGSAWSMPMRQLLRDSFIPPLVGDPTPRPSASFTSRSTEVKASEKGLCRESHTSRLTRLESACTTAFASLSLLSRKSSTCKYLQAATPTMSSNWQCRTSRICSR